jgi:hypothetical protein
MAAITQPIPPQTVGASLQYTQNLLGGPLNEYDSQVSVGLTPLVAAIASPDRVGLIIINTGTIDAFVSINPGVSQNNGIRVGNGGGSVTLNVTEDFTLTARQWYVVAIAAGPTIIYVIEYVRYSYIDTKYTPVGPTTPYTPITG